MRGRWHWLIPAVVIAGLLAPIPFTDRSFASDWGNHLWLIWVQGLNIGELGEPSYYLNSNLGILYPTFAFNGGSMYAVLGAISQVFNPEVAVLIGYAGALIACYLGWTWIAMQAGVTGWAIQLPGCIAVTAPYAVSNLYGRGDVPEAIATSMLPLVAASALAIVREPRVRLRASAAYLVSVAVLTGTHTLTLSWAVAFLALLAILLIACNWQLALERVRRSLTLGWLTAIGVGLSAWFLVPLIAFHGRLLEGGPDPIGYTLYTHPEHLFSLFRDSGDVYPEVTADVNTQLPVLALIWVLIGGALFWRYLAKRDKWLAAGLLVGFGGLVLMISDPQLIEHVPESLRYIQFPYRLITYADFCLVGLITLALVAMQRAGSAARVQVLLLAFVAAFAFVLSMFQNFEARSFLSSRSEALASPVAVPRSWYAPLQFADDAPLVEPAPTEQLLIQPERPGQQTFKAEYPPGPPGKVTLNLLTGSYFADLSGAKQIGRTAEGQMVVSLPGSKHDRVVTAKATWGTAVTVGRWITVASFLAAIGSLAFALIRRRRRRSRTI